MDPALFRQSSYGLNAASKLELLLPQLQQLTQQHKRSCEPYARILRAFSQVEKASSLADLPYLPVRLFKTHTLRSIAEQEVFKVLTSSGTTSQQVSRIYLDTTTAQLQTKALVAILQDFLGKHRRPMLIVDHPNVIKNRAEFSARGAGILGVSTFGRDHTYLLNEQMEIDFETLEAFLYKHSGKPLLMFGFTFMIWQYLYQSLLKTGKKVDLSRAFLLHSGGWKKLAEQAVANATFKDSLQELTGITQIANFYGMVEQVGSIFVECVMGHLHAPIFADVIVRDPETWGVAEHGELGVIEVLSILPQSYPGHVLLTEDLGRVLGEDDCSCGRLGKYFEVEGRIPLAELRGCSDTHSLVATA